MYGIKEQLTSSLESVKRVAIKGSYNRMGRVLYKVPSIEEGKFILLNEFEIIKIANIIYNSIFKEYPGLNLIYSYLIEMAKVLRATYQMVYT